MKYTLTIHYPTRGDRTYTVYDAKTAAKIVDIAIRAGNPFTMQAKVVG